MSLYLAVFEIFEIYETLRRSIFTHWKVGQRQCDNHKTTRIHGVPTGWSRGSLRSYHVNFMSSIVIFISRRDEERQHASGIQWGRHESVFLYRHNYNIIRTLCHPRLLHQQELITSYLRADQSGSDPLHASQR